MGLGFGVWGLVHKWSRVLITERWLVFVLYSIILITSGIDSYSFSCNVYANNQIKGGMENLRCRGR
jgi:hypothetical protein